VRLSFVAVSTALLVISFSGPSRAAVPIPKAPDVNARAYILVDHFSGRVLAEDKADEREEPASLTKLMTSYAVFKALRENRLKLTDPVTISEHAWRSEGSRTFVQVGSTIPAEILIKGMIVQSGNDATIALAEKIGGTESAFAELMNEYAKRLGMKATHFVNADGLPDPNHYTTARDMAILANALITEFPGSSSIKAREDASSALLNYGYTFYETGQVMKAGAPLLKARVYKSTEGEVQLVAPRNIVLTVGRGQLANIKSTPRLLKEPLIAPLPANDPIGELTITDQNGEVVQRIPLTPGKAVPEAGLWTRATDSVRLWFN
jgi:D-alanyl-D-alanine carboxypeptidase